VWPLLCNVPPALLAFVCRWLMCVCVVKSTKWRFLTNGFLGLGTVSGHCQFQCSFFSIILFHLIRKTKPGITNGEFLFILLFIMGENLVGGGGGTRRKVRQGRQSLVSAKVTTGPIETEWKTMWFKPVMSTLFRAANSIFAANRSLHNV
jgi:hypothetical protein